MGGRTGRHFGWREVRNLGVGFVLFCLLAAIVYPALAPAHAHCGRGSSCLSGVKQVGLATVIYSSDFDDRLPLQIHWATDLIPYTKGKDLFVCPLLNTGGGKAFGHAFRKSLAGVDTETVTRPEEAPTVFDSTNLTWNATGDLGTIPTVGRSPGGKSSIAFLDAHAKSLTRLQLLAAAADRHIH